MEQCLYALMLASANDIALQVAEQIGGSVDAFCPENERPCPRTWMHQYGILPILPVSRMTTSIPQHMIWL